MDPMGVHPQIVVVAAILWLAVSVVPDGGNAPKAVAGGSSIERAFGVHESAQFPRSAEVATQSAENLLRFFGDDAPHGVVELFRHRPR